MQATTETIELIRSAEVSMVNAHKVGVVAVIALIHDNISERFPHGAAVELASILKDGKVPSHSAKRYADLTAMAVKALNMQADIAAGNVKAKNADEKSAARIASIEANLAMLTSMASMAKVRDWSKANGPKAKNDVPAADVPAADVPVADVPAADVPVAPVNIEAIGQLREVKETLAMLNAGQITPAEALSTIAGVVGVSIAAPVPTKTARSRAKDKADKTVPKIA